MKLIISGCAGYIGATFTYEALKKGYSVIGIDNLSNSNLNNINKIKKIHRNNFTFLNENISNINSLASKIEKNNPIDAAIHFAALKNVSDSQKQPKKYYENNVIGTQNFIKLAKIKNIKKFIFSSSAAVYGEQEIQPLTEDHIPCPKSVYAETKLECEKIIQENADKGFFKAISLRYFNPIAAHKDLIITEDFGASETIISEIIKVALGKKESLEIFGNDYDTKDGTCERDFIHMQDLINGHISALEMIDNVSSHCVLNLGTGKSTSILSLIKKFKRLTNVSLKFNFSKKRQGDISKNFADVVKVKKFLSWQSRYNLEDMCIDSWKAVQNEN
tara:strand:- start:703 stop:1698 length:996 start_codon:yes stop_codon:yes gene_type:complete